MLLHDLILDTAVRHADKTALIDRDQRFSYHEMACRLVGFARALRQLSIQPQDRVAVFVDKQVETVTTLFGTGAAGGIAVPCNPALKGHQLAHILKDTQARVLVTTAARYQRAKLEIDSCGVETLLFVDDVPMPLRSSGVGRRWLETVSVPHLWSRSDVRPGTESDIAAILYTSGSTGLPKGVTLSHRNLIVGAESVAAYLHNDVRDVILALLPLSFDAGLSQLTTGFSSGATVVLHNYFTPIEVARLCAREGVTGITAVPPLWMQLLRVDWPEEASRTLRYFANTGGHMPKALLSQLRATFPAASPYLMYGLTEAFRSTYLDPREVDRRPDSIGKAIPNAEILVVRPDGTPCAPGEDGELVHRGPLVARGYWNDPVLTRAKFRSLPNHLANLPMPEPCVFSGDLVRQDAEGFLYYVGRTDDMIKVGGARVSPTEIEEVLYETGLVHEAATFGVSDDMLGQRIVACVVANSGATDIVPALMQACRSALPNFMVPADIRIEKALPRSPNGKIDRKALRAWVADDRDTVGVLQA